MLRLVAAVVTVMLAAALVRAPILFPCPLFVVLLLVVLGFLGLGDAQFSCGQTPFWQF